MANNRRKAIVRSHEFTLTNAVVATAGNMACLDTSTGKVTKGGTSTTLIPIGTFEETKTGTGSNRVLVTLSRQIELVVWENDTGTAVTTANIGSVCYVKDDTTVSGSSASSTRSVAGLVFDVSAAGVYVLHGFGASGATGASGNPGTTDLQINLRTACLAAGTALAAFADGASATPGIAVDNSEIGGIRWNNHATPSAVYLSVPLPTDIDDTANLILELDVSKTGATLGDATTFTVEAYIVGTGDLRDADADCGGTTDAMTGNAATKTMQKCSLTISAANVPAGARVLTLAIKPTAGTLGTDDVTIHAARVRCTRSL